MALEGAAAMKISPAAREAAGAAIKQYQTNCLTPHRGYNSVTDGAEIIQLAIDIETEALRKRVEVLETALQTIELGDPLSDSAIDHLTRARAIARAALSPTT